ncbi:hypothetical protein LCGC14_3001960, partial [marine sediment metagenome]
MATTSKPGKPTIVCPRSGSAFINHRQGIVLRKSEFEWHENQLRGEFLPGGSSGLPDVDYEVIPSNNGAPGISDWT